MRLIEYLVKMNELEEYTLLAVNAALHAGRDIMDIYRMDDDAFAVQAKQDASPLTAADTAGHARIMAYLATTGIPVLSEEGADIPYPERQGWERLWIVDPLDGTKEFIKRNGEFTVNLALVESGRPVLGVVYAPAVGTLYFGSRERGSFTCRPEEGDHFGTPGELLAVSTALPMLSDRKVYTVVASKSHRNPETDAYISDKEREHGIVEVVSRGSSLKLCLVAEGSADIYPRMGPTMEWDTAAGHAVARYAGARIYDPATGEEPVYNKPDLHNPWFIVERL